MWSNLKKHVKNLQGLGKFRANFPNFTKKKILAQNKNVSHPWATPPSFYPHVFGNLFPYFGCLQAFGTLVVGTIRENSCLELL